MAVVRIDTRRIRDWDSFHDVFAAAFGFPDFYGRNMNAWIDCMSHLGGPPEHGMTSVVAPPGEAVTIHLTEADDFAARCPEQFAELVECAAFVNWRLVEAGEPAVLALAYYRNAAPGPL